ncbi:Vacuolar fusion protein CCZ1 homolog B,Vacuolar fusion protein CCZ1 homolog [Mytilus coruscus]|uniref:Vacuolar fusion protein CCZ1 homolog B,Vacuolar fusion protein CCZ1 homolog n=1 Tax=Mytilus coruscus TaxID=42192 RepID=A0A6J8EY41_MYTCO|nr:Vacuolar fusion protein CCZ1 homolog B,Vacuolar fusion protein CCZ1 homolog [Mytilus coruscus]
MHASFDEKQEISTSCCCNSDKLSKIFTKYSHRPPCRQSSDQEIKHNRAPIKQSKSMAVKGGISLINFFVFNSEYGPREGDEEKKIMYYYPKNDHIDTKIKQIGLCEAICKFTETFSDKPCQSLHTQKTRQTYLEPEKDFWIIMTVSVPYTEKTKDGQPIVEYREEDVQDCVYEALLKQAYRMFHLFNGTFEHILAKNKKDVQCLKQRLEHFYSRYLQTLKPQFCDILDIFCGIHFMPLDKNTFLRVQCFINLLEAKFSAVKYTAFLYNDQLVWSGLEQEDMRIMYKYLTTSLFPTHLEQELLGSTTTSPARVQGSVHYGKFITGPPDIKDDKSIGKIPRVYLNTSEENEECYLLVYRAHNASVCMLINVSTTLNFDLCQKLDVFLGPQLTNLASDIGEQYSKRLSVSSDPPYRYIYFNHMNLAQKTTVHTDNKKVPGVNIPQDTLRLISDISSDMSRNGEDGETIVKTASDNWVVGKRSDQREFYVVINQKNANLIEINEEVKRLCASHFNSIFFLD